MEIHDRLKLARERAKYRTAKLAAEALGIPYGTYSGHENGKRGIPRDRVPFYARRYRVSVDWLLTGRGDPDSADLPVIGYVGAGGQVTFDAPLDGEDAVSRPANAPPEAVAVRIRGDSLGPGFDGWYAVYARREDPVTENLIGELCVVGTADGRTLVKWIRHGRRGYTLQSGTGAVEENARLKWGAKVLALQPH